MKNMWSKELKFPEDVYYSEEFLWVKDLGNKKFRVGVSDLGVKSVKQIAYVKLTCRKDAKVAKGDSIGHVETSKGIWEIIAPFAGTVIEINPPIGQNNAAPIVNDPYGDGWLVVLEIADDSELKALMHGADAETKKWINEKVEEVVPLMQDGDDDDDDGDD